MKRLFDILFSISGLLLLLPFSPVIAIWIRLDSPGPVFFRQIRVGRFGRLFSIYKFRTMRMDAPTDGREITVENDQRVTRSGSFLRKYKIDELPQLFNVLIGDMSVVGPRPEVPKYVSQYTEHQLKVIEFTPGITDPASIIYKRESSLLSNFPDPEKAYVESIMPDKLRLNLEYSNQASFLSDMRVIFQTLITIFR